MNIKQKADVNCRDTRPCDVIPESPIKQNGSVLNARGFTIIELIMVVAVLGILTAIGIPAYNKYKDKARNARAMSEIRTLDLAISAYFAERGVLPPAGDLSAVGYGTLLDPWGHPYHYAIGTRTFTGVPINPATYDLWSDGPNGATDPSGSVVTDPVSTDDIIRGLDGSFVGLAASYIYQMD